MALFLDGTFQNDMDTSNFAHVIFQNVGKSYLPHAALECHYTLTQFIRPHPKDWVGIFKVHVLLFSSSKKVENETGVLLYSCYILHLLYILMSRLCGKL